MPLLLEPARAGAGQRASSPTAEWCRVLDEAAELGVLQVHLSGGEPTARARPRGRSSPTPRGLGPLHQPDHRGRAARRAADRGACARPGSSTSSSACRRRSRDGADRVGGYRGGHAKKLVVARAIRAAGLPLTVNAVVHRQNLDQLEAMIALALELGAHRLEVAHVQYYGWALRNRAALMPTREQLEAATAIVERARARAARAGSRSTT